MKVTIYSTHGFEKSYLEKAAQNKHQLIFIQESLGKNTANIAKGSLAVSIFTGDDASETVIEWLHKIGVKYIALRSVGYDHVDLKKCSKLGIKVANVPAYSPFSVAEHALTLILCLNRKIKLGQELIKNNDFRLDQLIGFDMRNKTIGIIGTGNIGKAFARIAGGFGCKLLAFDIKENEDLKKEIGIKYVSLDELCKNSDIITLHCPLNDSTRHLLNKDKFKIMRDGVLIVNTSRGAVINTQDLCQALESGKVAGVGLDVYEFEKGLFFKDHPKIKDDLFKALQAKSNVIITGHQGFLTEEALKNIADTIIYNLDCWDKEKISPNDL